MIDYDSTATIHRPLRASRRALYLRIIVWAAVLAGVGLLVVGGMSGVSGPVFGLMALLMPLAVLGFVLLVMISYVMKRVRRRRGSMVISYLEQAVRLNLPLGPWLDAGAASERGALQQRLADLRLMLAQGLPVWRSADLSVLELSERQVAVIGAGERSGRLGAALQRLLREERRDSAAEGPETAFRVVYPTIMAILLLMVVSTLMIFVMPKFEGIFMDFAIPLPETTLLLMAFGRSFGGWLGLLAVVCLIVSIGRALERTFVGWRYAAPWRPVSDRVIWWMPAVAVSVRSRQWADFCHAMSAALAGALPFNRALADAMAAVTNRVAQAKLERWYEHLKQGQTPSEAARQAGMPGIMVGLLATANHGEDAAAVFGFLARYYDMRFSRSHAVLTSAMVPLVTLLFAAIVAFVALGLFVPMINLIDSVQLHVWSGQ